MLFKSESFYLLHFFTFYRILIMVKFSYAHDAFFGSLVGESVSEPAPAKTSGHDFVAEWLVASITDDAITSIHPESKPKRVINDIWHS